ncbi:uncharacterized protein STEHIDRAFT_140168 [Stereum hirsutum FP-91666 SS1]|uniref:uncharacterized protein n=1 Tax=Stereum hirsutum (strain FP-91666) TaxID=721885 RepID=UPI0004449454|nr:uncharacterized protein STEHIDRAFT_140168 [Stereum hirsutum FP-91666 SS1]EIM85571.1 hypothetical protein STEHIDRAFT_140168 [Stereum hirsutum FP-91666 SS1]
MLFVERHYLRQHNASFSENFYGLKRRRRPLFETERTKTAVSGVFPGENLRTREVWRSLLLLVGLPYIRAKAQDYFEDLGGGIDSDLIDDAGGRQIRALIEETWRGRWRRLYKKLYPWLNMGFEHWLLVYNVAYLFEKTPYYRLWLSWIGVDLRRLGIDDYRAESLAAQRSSATTPPPKSHLDTLRHIFRNSPRFLLDYLKLLLPTTIFFIKFLEWWYSPSSPARSLTLSSSPLGPFIPPPALLRPHPQGLKLDGRKYGKCPICGEGIKNATALPSGYVFCYRCAYEEVEKSGRCPVTLLPARVWQLRKVLV